MNVRIHPALSLILLAGCARMEPPPGGPEDKTRPFVTGAYPGPAAVQVPRDMKARVAFSEWVNRDAERGKVWISPPPAGKLRVKIDGNILEVSPSSPLDTGTTYILGVAGTVRDLHGLPLEAPFQLSFSTGAALDPGILSGRLAVFPGIRPKAGAFAALYPLDQSLRRRFAHLAPRPGPAAASPSPSLSPSDSAPHPFRERPAYISPADSLGRFDLEGVRPGRYLLAAFQDSDQDLVPDPGAELFAVGPAVAVGADPGPARSLALAAFDTVPSRLLEARWVHETLVSGRSQGTVRLKFSRPPHPVGGLRRDLYTVRKTGAEGGAGWARVREAGLDPVTGEVELYTDPLEPESSYTVRCAAVPDAQGNPLDTSRDEAPFRAALLADSARAPAPGAVPGAGAGASPGAPEPIFLGPRRMSGMREKLAREGLIPARGITAYYPLILTDSVLADLGARLEVRLDTAPVAFSLARAGHHEFSLKLGAVPLRGQTLHIGFKAVKLASGAGSGEGPAPGPSKPRPDSAAAGGRGGPKASFKVADSSRLGSLQFRQDVTARGSMLVLRSLADLAEYSRSTPAAEEFTVDSLPAGWYSIEYFRDEDRDSVWSPGRLRPWTPQENLVHFADSVEVRAAGTSAAGPSGGRLGFPPIW